MDNLKTRKTNNRKFPGIKGRRPDNAKHRRAEAIDRQKVYDGLTANTKLQLLDDKLGVGVGAQKQRARLQAIIDGVKK